MKELNTVLQEFESNDKIKCIVLSGEDTYFAAGADIKEMKDLTYPHVLSKSFLNDWNYITTVNKPVIASVCGYALGGGCELAMMCDIIIAGNNAVSEKPKLKLGIILEL